ncbi:MAG: Ig-like domain-containing protein [Gemmatimonadaceae bacterium]
MVRHVYGANFIRSAGSTIGAMTASTLLACSSAGHDTTAPADIPATVTLTVSQARITAPGDITLSATATGANGVAVQRVEFYEQVVGVDASPRKIGEDLEPPYEMKRSIQGVADNGNRSFTARDYDVAGHTGVSSPVVVTVELSDIPPFQATVTPSHTRITTPGYIHFVVTADRAIARVEAYNGATKVGENLSPSAPYSVAVAVTAATNGAQVYVVKAYDAAGNTVQSPPITVVVDIRWDLIRVINGFHGGGEPRLAIDATNSVYLAGENGDHSAFLLTKFDATGNQLWSRQLGTGDWGRLGSIGIDASGRVWFAGDMNSTGTRCFLTLYGADGSLLRTESMDVSGFTSMNCFGTSDASGNFYVAGTIKDLGTTNDVVIAKYDRDGNNLWIRQVGSEPGGWDDDSPRSIAVDAAGAIYLTGGSSGSFDGAPKSAYADLFLLKLDADGNRLWSKQLRQTGISTSGQRLALDPTGGLYIAGITNPQGSSQRNALIAHYTSDGVLSWQRTLVGGEYDLATAVAADQHGAYLVGMTTRNTGAHDITEQTQQHTDGFLAKYSVDGGLSSVRLLSQGFDLSISDVALAANGDAYVAATESGILILARHRDASP